MTGDGYLTKSFLVTTGTVFNIQRYSIHDGPGIRTTVQPPSEEKLSEISGILSKFNLNVKLRG